MYLRTPKRYRADHKKRHLRLIPRRLLLLVVLVPLVYLGGRQALQHDAEIRAWLFPRVENMAHQVATQVSPRPTPTPTPDVAEAQRGCVNAERQGNLREATINCQILADSSPNDVVLHYKVAHMLVISSVYGTDSDRIEQALEYAERTINANPEAPHGWAIRALALNWHDETDAALASALHARALDANFAPTYAFLGGIYYDLGKPDVALTYLEQAAELDVDGLATVHTLRNRALLASSIGDYQTATQYLRSALEIAPNHSYVAVELADNYVALDQFDNAMDVLGRTLERNPEDPLLLWRMGWLQVQAGTADRAYEYYRRCLDSEPDNRRCLSYLGGLQFSDQDYVSAVPNLTRAIELGSTDTSDFYQLGMSYAYQNQCDLGAPYLQQGYELAVEQGKETAQDDFANALQSACNRTIVPVAPPVTPIPAVTEEPFATATPAPG